MVMNQDANAIVKRQTAVTVKFDHAASNVAAQMRSPRTTSMDRFPNNSPATGFWNSLPIRRTITSPERISSFANNARFATHSKVEIMHQPASRNRVASRCCGSDDKLGGVTTDEARR